MTVTTVLGLQLETVVETSFNPWIKKLLTPKVAKHDCLVALTWRHAWAMTY